MRNTRKLKKWCPKDYAYAFKTVEVEVPNPSFLEVLGAAFIVAIMFVPVYFAALYAIS